MLSKEELTRYPNYILSKYQLEIYRQVVNYMESHNFSKTDLARQMGVSNPYVSQILNGNFNYTLKKLIEIGLTIGQVPELKFTPLSEYKISSFEEPTLSYNPQALQVIVGKSNSTATLNEADNSESYDFKESDIQPLNNIMKIA